jgi:hypothetical protein
MLLGGKRVCWTVPHCTDDGLWFPRGIIVLGVGVELRLDVGNVLGEGFGLGFELGVGLWDILKVGVVVGVVEEDSTAPNGTKAEMGWVGEVCGVTVLTNVLFDVPKVEVLLRVDGWSLSNF